MPAPAAAAQASDWRRTARVAASNASGNQAAAIAMCSSVSQKALWPLSSQVSPPTVAPKPSAPHSPRRRAMPTPAASRWTKSRRSCWRMGSRTSMARSRGGYNSPEAPSSRAGIPPKLNGSQSGRSPARTADVAKTDSGYIVSAWSVCGYPRPRTRSSGATIAIHGYCAYMWGPTMLKVRPANNGAKNTTVRQQTAVVGACLHRPWSAASSFTRASPRPRAAALS